MAPNEEKKLKWAALLEVMVADYRRNKPNCLLTDLDIVQGIMLHFQKTGLISRRADGKWCLPVLVI